MGAGGVAHDENGVGVATKLARVIMGPMNRLCDVAGHFLYGDLRQKAICGGNKDASLFCKRLWFVLYASFASGAPATAVDPENDWMIFPFGRGIDVEQLTFVSRLRVRNIPLDL